ncbi:MAG: RtcB family protein, partial [Methylobacteriaceae bacterium]|nr:RtcB family protein [Methylobacteriaceae bacterium]
MASYETLQEKSGWTDLNLRVPVKMWTVGIPVEEAAMRQLAALASLPFIHCWIAVMPDAHSGKGSTVGSVIPTIGAVIPAAVGVDIGCGMTAALTPLTRADLPRDLGGLRLALEQAVPHGRTNHGLKGDVGAWNDNAPPHVEAAWAELEPGYRALAEKYPVLQKANTAAHLGTLGTGN